MFKAMVQDEENFMSQGQKSKGRKKKVTCTAVTAGNSLGMKEHRQLDSVHSV
jgi:hypothetical protein